MAEETFHVSKIRSGTVIDHVTNGQALDVLRILGVKGRWESGVITVAMNVPSKKLGKKDILKIEGKELDTKEVDKIALLAPHATINIIRDFKVVGKQRVKLPSIVKGIVKCANPTCISNSGEPIQPTFYVESEEPLSLRCHYCGRIMEKEVVLSQF